MHLAVLNCDKLQNELTPELTPLCGVKQPNDRAESHADLAGRMAAPLASSVGLGLGFRAKGKLKTEIPAKSVMSPESIQPDTRWKIKIDKEAFDKLKIEESFWQIVALSRAVNSLRFDQTVLEPYHEDDSPAAVRVRYNSFIFGCALLYEVSKTVQFFGKHHRDLPEYKAMTAVINTHAALDLRDSNLGELRNKLVFHFGYDEIGIQLAKLKLEEPIFAIGKGDTNKQVYLELADLCVINAFAGFAASEKEEDVQRMTELIKKTTELLLQFVDAADLFIRAVLQSTGWAFEKIDSR